MTAAAGNSPPRSRAVTRPDGPDEAAARLAAIEKRLERRPRATAETDDGARPAGRHAMSAEDRALLDAVAAVAAEAIDGWRTARRALEHDRALAEHRGLLIEETAALLAAMREVTAYEDPSEVRPAICRIAWAMTGADSAAIYEIDPTDAALVPVEWAGDAWPMGAVDLADTAAPAVRAFLGGKAVLATGADAPGRLRRRRGPGAAYWQPLPAGGSSSAAVIGLAWASADDVTPDRLADLMDVLAVEAMRALERAELLRRLEELARTDELTGLPNRRAVWQALERELERARREGHDVCVALLDLDRFKHYNDTHGHPAGDRLLARAAGAWRDALRGGTDVIGRYGGEEFLVVLPAPPEAAVRTLERLRRATPDRQTASAGLAAWDRAETAERLVARADAALYVAKQSGRDRIACAPSGAPPPPSPGGSREPEARHAPAPRPPHRLPAAPVSASSGPVGQLRGPRTRRRPR